MSTLQQITDECLKEFDERFVTSQICHGCGEKKCDHSTTACPQYISEMSFGEYGKEIKVFDAIKSHLISSIKKAVEKAYKEIEVEKKYTGGGTKEREMIFNSALSFIEKKKSLFLHECCNGECNHDDCCGKVLANCPLKDNK